jgi:hypothetical protein
LVSSLLRIKWHRRTSSFFFFPELGETLGWEDELPPKKLLMSEGIVKPSKWYRNAVTVKWENPRYDGVEVFANLTRHVAVARGLKCCLLRKAPSPRANFLCREHVNNNRESIDPAVSGQLMLLEYVYSKDIIQSFGSIEVLSSVRQILYQSVPNVARKLKL